MQNPMIKKESILNKIIKLKLYKKVIISICIYCF